MNLIVFLHCLRGVLPISWQACGPTKPSTTTSATTTFNRATPNIKKLWQSQVVELLHLLQHLKSYFQRHLQRLKWWEWKLCPSNNQVLLTKAQVQQIHQGVKFYIYIYTIYTIYHCHQNPNISGPADVVKRRRCEARQPGERAARTKNRVPVVLAPRNSGCLPGCSGCCCCCCRPVCSGARCKLNSSI